LLELSVPENKIQLNIFIFKKTVLAHEHRVDSKILFPLQRDKLKSGSIHLRRHPDRLITLDGVHAFKACCTRLQDKEEKLRVKQIFKYPSGCWYYYF